MTTLVLRTPPLSGRIALRSALVCSALVLLCVVVTGLALSLGEIVYSPGEVLAALTGHASGPAELFVVGWRLPRAAAAVVFGAMLGVAGALFQTITRNPLGSPDIIGFTAGSSLAGTAAIVLIGSGFAVVAAGALLGGLVVAAAMVLLSRGGGAAGFRLVIAGIALNAMLVSTESWLVLAADLDAALAAALWGAGTLNGADFAYIGAPMLFGVIAILLTVVLLGRRLDLLDMGDDTGTTLGGRPARTRLYAIGVGVLLVALVTAAAGPIALVALAAPHIGRRLAGSTGNALIPAACAGALLLAAADLAAQHLVPGQSYPVGVVTVVGGGLYLMTLIIRENRTSAW
ncbi:ABC-type Fe3+-siderophore transport system, permease 2 component [Pseudonocardia sp. Ae168_Ps1]|uniref:FecCD family ABC transporter permease n=1 Tax=unclassified Pseudonocardia TaxID=2619320 RepID=UPI00094B04C9|nr:MULTISPECIES: iron chelate uptake ABC transporter family permease subunit [unclassified Pseudonocardia]OLL73494.1 ABC-type Fe3+-siderophore transport system, permease 2 component [Pseudonocardia sp. Ae150A_Ps1]OLL79472.1 ABC-type Fe3+-siderophore transport system, permease 2 component [Pseudonocardia sp. Ae168_Ps1]OLL93565.1 ABC-type Fe3+-siderophore transport system, permease 2 component [Pseudonocardia sp. Ae356_Ps1]